MKTTVQTISPLNEQVMQAAKERWDNLTKPLGSLGKLEQIGIRLAGIQGTIFPSVEQKAVVVMCGDHGVVEEGVSAYPQAVTGLMIQNFVNGKAAINVLSKQAGAQVHVVDVGSCLEEPCEGVHFRKVRLGTANMAQGPAMTREEAVRAIEVGIEMVEQLHADGVQIIALGEMGIGNTTPTSALTAVLTGKPLDELVGRGTGIQEESLLHKMQVIQRAIDVNQPDPNDALDALSKIGGLEIAGLSGVVLGAAARKIAVVVDGVIAGAAALVAARMEPQVQDYLFASHLSQEPAHAVILRELGLEPMLMMEMRLGEGSGAMLAMPLFESAVRLVAEMATFADLGL